MKTHIFSQLFLIFLWVNVYAQKEEPMKIWPATNLPETITVNSRQKILFKVKNIKLKNIIVSNVPILNFGFNVLKQIGNNYTSIDSMCTFLPQPRLPRDGFKDVKFRVGQIITIPFPFPPHCCIETGNYKLQFIFYYSVNGKPQSVETKWYKLSVKD